MRVNTRTVLKEGMPAAENKKCECARRDRGFIVVITCCVLFILLCIDTCGERLNNRDNSNIK